MAYKSRRTDGNGYAEHTTITPCQQCNSRNQTLRHRHLLTYSGDLKIHLMENLPRKDEDKLDQVLIDAILSWVVTIKQNYGGRVTDTGAPIDAAQCRVMMHKEYEGYYPRKHQSPGQRKVTFSTFRVLLNMAQSRHAQGWLEMLDNQFSHGVNDDEDWGRLLQFMNEYYHSAIDPNNADFLERINLQPIVARIGRAIAR